MNFKKTSRGFTLIELLVVVAIIALLSSIALASLSTARAKTRDTIRTQTLRSFQTALEAYRIDHDAYPSGGWYGTCYGGVADYIPGLTPTYISSLPVDPSTSGCYLYISNGIDYKILAWGTVETVYPVPSSNFFYDPVRSNERTFQVSTPYGRTAW